MLVGGVDNKAAGVDYIQYIRIVGYMVVDTVAVVGMVAVVDIKGCYN